MDSPAAAIAWEFRARHRWGLRALGVYVAALIAVRFVVRGGIVHLDTPESFAAVVILPLTSTFLYFLAVFSFGLAGDIAGRDSIFPRRMFTMPLTTGALAGWPMLYGAVAAVILWFVIRLLGIWPPGFEIPRWWPALLAASLMAWTQALTWMPYPLRGLRVIVTVLWLATIDAVVMIALQFKPPEWLMLTILAPHIPLAYLTARHALGRARRGEVPDWRRGVLEERSAAAKPFASAHRAQVWFEWRQSGRVLPALVAILLPFELAMLFLFHETPSIVFGTLIGILLTPPFMAMFVAAAVSDVNSFVIRRPLDNRSLVAAKIKAAAWSAAETWLLLLVLSAAGLALSGTAPLVVARGHRLAEIVGFARAAAMCLLALAALIASTWKQLVQSLYIGMSGREWLAKASVFGALSLLAIAGPLLHWILSDRGVLAIVWNGFPWFLAALVCLKVGSGGWIAMRLHDERVVSDRVLIGGAALWDALVFAVYGVLVWIFPALLVRRYFLALISILAVPLARLGAAPLALERSRHR